MQGITVMDMNDIENFKLCCRLSLLSYGCIKDLIRDIQPEDFYFINIDDVEAILLYTNKKIYIVFRGTEPTSKKDIIRDILFFKTKSTTEGNVHSGFRDGLDKVWTPIKAFLRKYSGLPVICTGHSLGGAFASILASRIKAKLLVTFGSPRVGDKTWVKANTVKHYRFVNNNDIVPSLPFKFMFAHHGKLMYFNIDGKLKNLTFSQKIKDILKGYLYSFKKLQLFDFLYDHKIEEYYNKIVNL